RTPPLRAAASPARLRRQGLCDGARNHRPLGVGRQVIGGKLSSKADFKPVRQRQKLLKDLAEDKRDLLIKTNPDYGQIVCRCEEISKGEIIDALNRPLPVNTTDGIKRRIRAGMGRCQGGFCQQLIVQIMAEEQKVSLCEIKKKGSACILLCDNKEDDDEKL
ncbi:MAG TPA: (2Fe-2S)-binding protein, partial [Bacilli bacterium]|nr:(2Fe-2S)-binding protein [Bacilli bacterium]